MQSFAFSRAPPSLSSYEVVPLHSLAILLSLYNKMFRAILSVVSRFRAHKSSLHSQRCSRIWTLHSHTGSPCKSRNVFPSRFLPAPRRCLASQRKSLTLYVSLLLLMSLVLLTQVFSSSSSLSSLILQVFPCSSLSLFSSPCKKYHDRRRVFSRISPRLQVTTCSFLCPITFLSSC